MKNKEQAALTSAIEKLYSVFETYPLKPEIDACECCHTPEETQVLYSKPLRQLTEDDLTGYAWDAITTWGDVEDFKHFLPRLFECVAEDPGYLELEPLFSKLHHGKWRDWPAEEQAAVEQYFMAVWKWCLLREGQEWLGEDMLCAIAQAVYDMTPYLAEWRRQIGMPAYEKLAHLVSYNRKDLALDGLLSNPWWTTDSGGTSQMRQVVDWLLEWETVQMLERGIQQAQTEQVSEKLSSALEHLHEVIRRRRM